MNKNRSWYNISLSNKLILFIIIILIGGIFTSSLISYFLAKEELDEKGKTILKNSVRLAELYAESKYHLVSSSEIEREAVLETIRTQLIGEKKEDGTRNLGNQVDFGENGYFIMYDLDGNEIMHPRLEGENVWSVVDPKNKDFYLVQDQIKKAINGGGFTYYSWNYPNKNNIGAKVSYSKFVDEWDLVLVGTAYLSDFNSAANSIIRVSLLTSIILLTLGIVTSISFVKRINQPINKIVSAMKAVAKGKYIKVDTVYNDQEIGKLVSGFNEMVDSLEKSSVNLKIQREKIEHLAYYDQLSGLANYNLFKEFVESRIENNEIQGILLQLDIKDFKAINSLIGYENGNKIIKIIGNSLDEIISQKNMIARTSGNEFSIWMEDNTDINELINELTVVYNRKIKNVDIAYDIDFYKAVVNYPLHGETFDEIFRKASVAMKYIKDSSESGYITFREEMANQLDKEISLLEHIKKAMVENEFTAAYQSKVDVKTKEVIGVEGLTRWYSETLGYISPYEFMQIINTSDLSTRFGEYTMNLMFGDYFDLVNKYGRKVTLSINISPLFFLDANFINIVKKYVKKYNLPAERIIFEITEDVLIYDFREVRSRIRTLHEMGISISIDDFGTGYSSLNYLQEIQADELKIDKSFVDEILSDHRRYEVFSYLCKMAKAYDYDVVVEGVETLDQYEKIKNDDINLIQGYLFSKPERL
ncbi:MAG TPA: EAL domain-containing protein [Clostridia bacterium]|nr:EAL domain-containing protein [Clostridia bacterium]